MKRRGLARALFLIGIIGVGCLPPMATAVHATESRTTTHGIIRSQDDLHRYLSVAATAGSPLDSLSPAARRRFLASLKFNAAGITSFRFDDLQRELTVSQAYDVLALFDAQRDVAIIPHLRIKTIRDRQKLAQAVAQQ